MWKCPKCNTKIDDSSNVCPDCGYKNSEQSSTLGMSKYDPEYKAYMYLKSVDGQELMNRVQEAFKKIEEERETDKYK